MHILTRPLSITSLLTVATVAHGQAWELEVDGQRYVAQQQLGTIFVLPDPVSINLVREPQFWPPACEELDTVLTRLSSFGIKACSEEPASSACMSFITLVDSERFVLGTIGSSQRDQVWIPHADSMAVIDDEVLEAVAQEVADDTLWIRPWPHPMGVGQVKDAHVEIDPSGSSWASRLAGIIDFNVPGVSYIEEDQAFFTSDHLLACAMLNGDARIEWEQTPGPDVPAVFTPDALWTIYQDLGKVRWPAGSPLKRAVRVGEAISAALKAAGLVDEALPERVELLLSSFFDPASLRYRTGLDRDTIDELAASTAIEALPTFARFNAEVQATDPPNP